MRRTALVVPVPEAEPLVAEHRARHDPSAALGVPAHITILVPWVGAEQVAEPDREAIRAIAARTAAFEYELGAFGRFEGGTLFLRPDPPEPFVRLTEAVVGRWPDHPPYEGAFAEIVPHLTVAESADDASVAAIEAEVTPHLPLVATASSLLLLVEEPDGRWAEVERMRFA